MFYNTLDKGFTNKPIAVITTPDGYQQDYAINHIAGKYFFVQFNKASGGIFEIDMSKKVLWRGDFFGWQFTKIKLYYDARNQNPIDIKVLKDLQKFAKRNNLIKITRKNLNQGDRLRQKVNAFNHKNKRDPKVEPDIDELIAIKDELQKENDAAIAPLEAIKEDLEVADDKKEALQTAVKESKIEMTLAERVYQLLQQGITVKNIIDILHDENRIEIEYPISPEASQYLKDFMALEPEYTFTFLQAMNNTKKVFERLKSKKVSGGFQFTWIIIIIGIGLAAAWFLPDMLGLGTQPAAHAGQAGAQQTQHGNPLDGLLGGFGLHFLQGLQTIVDWFR